VKAFQQHAPAAEMWEDASTVAAGLRVPKPLGDFIILQDVYESGGEAVAATDDDLMDACRVMARCEGILAAPEGGAGLAAIRQLVGRGAIARDESVVLFNTGSGYKYMEAWNAAIHT
jgi:threonine synthase